MKTPPDPDAPTPADTPTEPPLPADAQAEPKLPDCNRSLHKALLDGLYDGVYFVNCDRRITYWNHSAESLTGYTAGETVGAFCYGNLLEHVTASGRALCFNGCPLHATLKDGKRRQGEMYLRHKDGHRVPVQVRVAPIRSEKGQIIGAVEMFNAAPDKTGVERRLRKLQTLAYRDSLTELANRRYIELKLQQALQEQQEFGRTFGVLMIDIDHFKEINDQHGHEAGDAALKTVSRTLVLSIRHDDSAGRWGGDEFIVLLVDMDRAVLNDLAERCRKLISASVVTASGSSLRVTASIGATMIRQGDSPQSIAQRVDELLYRSKAGGRNRTTVG